MYDADILLHVIDVGNSLFEEQAVAVEKNSRRNWRQHKPTINVLNKSDQVADKELLEILCRRMNAVAISALDKARCLF
jgi:GTP-binding protein HflX